MIISSIIYSKKLIDIHKLYSISSPHRVWAEDKLGPSYVAGVEQWSRSKARREYERNRAVESLAYIGILALFFIGL